MSVDGNHAHVTPRHEHLWFLADGTGLHAPYAQVVTDDETGRLCCHLCGRWFRALGSHVRVHGHTADTYREAMGLCTTAALTCGDVSTALAVRGSRRYAEDRELQTAFTEARERLQASPPQRKHGEFAAPEPAQRRATRKRTLATGRETMAHHRSEERGHRLRRLGFADLHDYLRSAHAAGASLDLLARTTGLGRATLRQELDAAGVRVRSTGRNTAEGKRSRAKQAERIAAELVGTDDLTQWLRERRDSGWSLSQLGRATGRSYHWVAWRLDAHGAASARGNRSSRTGIAIAYAPKTSRAASRHMPSSETKRQRRARSKVVDEREIDSVIVAFTRQDQGDCTERAPIGLEWRDDDARQAEFPQ